MTDFVSQSGSQPVGSCLNRPAAANRCEAADVWHYVLIVEMVCGLSCSRRRGWHRTYCDAMQSRASYIADHDPLHSPLRPPSSCGMHSRGRLGAPWSACCFSPWFCVILATGSHPSRSSRTFAGHGSAHIFAISCVTSMALHWVLLCLGLCTADATGPSSPYALCLVHDPEVDLPARTAGVGLQTHCTRPRTP